MPLADKEALRAYQREWLRKRREQWFKENGPCAMCGSDVDLVLDHVDPKQKVNHRVFSWSAVRRNAELAKCQVLCRPCHVIKTAQDGSHPRGADRSDAKLTDEAVREIRQRQSNGEQKKALARDFGVSEKLIRLICKREVWKHI